MALAGFLDYLFARFALGYLIFLRAFCVWQSVSVSTSGESFRMLYTPSFDSGYLFIRQFTEPFEKTQIFPCAGGLWIPGSLFGVLVSSEKCAGHFDSFGKCILEMSPYFSAVLGKWIPVHKSVSGAV